MTSGSPAPRALPRPPPRPYPCARARVCARACGRAVSANSSLALGRSWVDGAEAKVVKRRGQSGQKAGRGLSRRDSQLIMGAAAGRS